MLKVNDLHITYQVGKLSYKGEIRLGEVQLARLNENELAEVRNRRLGFVFQYFMLLDGLTMKENIMRPRVISGRIDKSMSEGADRLCQVFGISHIRGKYPAEVSGGECQRTAVARALINNPLLILADETTGNLDYKSSRAVIQFFQQAQDSLDATIFMVTLVLWVVYRTILGKVTGKLGVRKKA